MSDAFALEIQPACNVQVNVPSGARLFEVVDNRLSSGRGFTLATLNLDHVVKLRLSPKFRRVYKAHRFVVADGTPIVWLSRLADRPVDLIPGCELVLPLCELAARKDIPVALVGASEAALDRAAKRLKARVPELKIVMQHAPSWGFDPEGSEADACLADIRRSGARLCVVALGAPKQEIVAIRASKSMPGCGFVSVGAGIDFIAGTQHRAPEWMRRNSLEWFWRLATNPRRLFRRYTRCAMVLPSLAVSVFRKRRQRPERKKAPEVQNA